MSLDSGRVSLRRFYIRGKVPASSNAMWIEGLKSKGFEEKKLELEEDNCGWAIFGNELLSDFEIENVVHGKFLLFSIRRDIQKVPGGLLQIHLKRRIHEEMKERNAEVIGRKQKAEIKQELLEELVQDTPSTIQVIQVLVDPSRNEVYLANKSEKMGDIFLHLFESSFNLKILQANHMAMGRHLVDKDAFEAILDEPEIRIMDNLGEIHPEFEDSPESRLGSAFLTWLMYYLSVGDGTYKSSAFGEVGLLFDQYILMEGEYPGSHQTLIKKGLASQCRELLASLSAGKLLSRAELMLAHDYDGKEFQSTLMMDKKYADLGINPAKSPDSDPKSRFQDRLEQLGHHFELMDDLFKDYLDMRYSPKWPNVRKKMKAWVKSELDRIFEHHSQ